MFKLTRIKNGPILSPDAGLPWETEGVFNPGAIKAGDEVVMLYRAVGERRAYISRFGLAKSKDGYSFKRSSDRPVFDPGDSYDAWGVEDPRIVKIDDWYYVTYVAVPERILYEGEFVGGDSPVTTAGALSRTKDFFSYERLGVVTPKDSDNKDTVLFPQKIGGRYAVIHRPNRWSQAWVEKGLARGGLPDVALPYSPSMWIAYSDDLKTWSDHKVLIAADKGEYKNGAGLPPIETPDGWLLIYHAIEKRGEFSYRYFARAALLDKDDPTKVISVLPYEILSPEMPYETKGEMSVVFPTGGFVENDTLFVYYGASDMNVGLATGSISELLIELKRYKIA